MVVTVANVDIIGPEFWEKHQYILQEACVPGEDHIISETGKVTRATNTTHALDVSEIWKRQKRSS